MQVSSIVECVVLSSCSTGWPVRILSLFPSNFLAGRERSIQRLMKWLTGCVSEYQLCRRTESSWEPPAPFVDIGQAGTDLGGLVKVVETEKEESYHYIALSHRCTPKTGLASLTNDNINKWTKGSSENELPDDFREAIRIARAVGIQYI